MKRQLEKLQNIPWKKMILLADQVMVSGSNFLLGILLVRILGLESYGVYALLWMIVLFALGINQALITKPILSIAPKMKKAAAFRYLHDIQLLQIALAGTLLLAGISVWSLAGLFGFSIPHIEYVPIISGILFFQLYHDFFRKSCFINDKITLAFFMDAALYLGQLLLIAWFGYLGQLTLLVACYCILVANIIGVGIGFAKFGIRIADWKQISTTWKRQFQYAKWLIGTAFLQWFSGNYFILIGATFLGPIAVGALRMVQNIMGFLHILFLSMENIIPIEAARKLQTGGWTAMSQFLKKMTLKLGIIFLLLLVSIATLSPWIIKLLYGAAYLEYSYIVVVYCGLYVLVYLSLPLQFALRTIELTYPLFVAYVAATIFSFLTANLFLQNWGMAGLLSGLISTQFITCSIYALYCRQYGKTQQASQKITI